MFSVANRVAAAAGEKWQQSPGLDSEAQRQIQRSVFYKGYFVVSDRWRGEYQGDEGSMDARIETQTGKMRIIKQL